MWTWLLWGSVAAVLYAYAGYPFILYLLGRFSRRRVVCSRCASPAVTLIISAYNEARVIRRKLENSLDLDYPRQLLDIVVASDGSDDDTVAIASEYIEWGVRVVHQAVRRGKSAMLNDVLASVQSDIVVFTDANAMFERGAVRRLACAFEDDAVGCVVGRLAYAEDGATSAGRGEGMYWRYEGMISRLESRIGHVCVANGSIFAARTPMVRHLYPEVANDFQIPVDVAAAGADIVYEPAAVARECVAHHWQEEFGRKVRIVLRGFTGFSALHRRIGGFRRFQFISHKLLRWQVGWLMIIAFISSAVLSRQSLFYAIVTAAQIGFYALAAVGWMRRCRPASQRVFYIPFYFTLVNCAALVATVRFAMGRRQSLWEKAESTRRDLPAVVAVVPATAVAPATATTDREVEVAPELAEN